MRYASLNEREEFYRREFSVGEVEGWFRNRMKKPVFAVIIGRHTRIYPQEYEEDASTTILIDEYKSVREVKGFILDFLPEAVYYDRNIYDARGKGVGQELAFDLDPENITCPIHGSLAEKMKRRQGLSFCALELRMIKEQTLRLYEHLENRFSSVEIVYSGRGFHVHVFDEEAYAMNRGGRERLAKSIKADDFPIDEWVTSGSMRLIRLPFSLHGLVSRIVLPLKPSEVARFDPRTDERCVPKFLRK